MTGTLYLVATPIGNLEDITLRALRVLKEVKLIACEDTRQTGKLLQHFLINTPTISYHEHNERERAPQLLARLIGGESIAVVSDAGTPIISDPGFILVREAMSHQIPIVAVPGASALLTGLVASGLSAQEFLFIGFLPARTGERQRRLTQLANVRNTIVCYESPHRIALALADAGSILGERKAVIARELTKFHEEFLRGTLPELAARLADQAIKGEIVLIIEGATETAESNSTFHSLHAAVAAKMESDQIDKMSALKAVARLLGISKSEAYRRLQTEEAQGLADRE